MWVERNIAGLNVGEDKNLSFEIYDLGSVSLTDYPSGYVTPTELETLIADATAAPLDVSGFAFEFIVRKSDKTTDAALIDKSSDSPAEISITGTYNADPLINTQRVVVALFDTDTAAADGSAVLVPPKTYRYALKRTDAGAETVFAKGDFDLAEATAR